MDYKAKFIIISVIAFITMVCIFLIAYKKGVNITKVSTQFKIAFWSSLPFGILLAILADVSIGWKVVMVIAGIITGSSQFIFSVLLEKICSRHNK